MRYLAIGLMALAVVCTGFLAAEWWAKRMKRLQILRQMVYHLKSQILYSNESLPEAMRVVGERFDDSESGRCFLRIAQRAENERDRLFSLIWEEEIKTLFRTGPISEGDYNNLLNLGRQLGGSDRVMQERTILFYLEETDDAIQYLKREVDGRRKLYWSLGLAAGACLVIILI